jgi:hypothetical protein
VRALRVLRGVAYNCGLRRWHASLRSFPARCVRGAALNRRFARLMMPACSWVVRRSQAVHAVFCRPGFDVLSNLEIMFFTTSADLFATVRYVCRWLALSALLGALAGTASALFLIALDWATGTRVASSTLTPR